MECMKRITTYDAKNKRYTTGLLFKKDCDPKVLLDDNYNVCFAVMKAAFNKAIKDKTLEPVNFAYQELIERNFCSKISSKMKNTPKGRIHYIPTHPVYQFQKELTTLPVRLVLNCSSKCKATGKSLNDLLYTGPNLLPEIATVLMKFRLKKYQMVADITKMFYCVFMRPEDKTYQRFLWRFSQRDEAQILEMNNLVFGAISSPFQAIYCVLDSTERFESKYPLAAPQIRETLYMDDTQLSGTTKTEAIAVVRQANGLFAESSMIAHKWNSNDKTLLKQAGIPPDRISPLIQQKVLGVKWNSERDSLTFDFSAVISEVQIETKRTLLMQTARLYDPLGILTPFILRAKLLIQRCWLDKDLEWDTPLKGELLEDWKIWKAEIIQLKELEIDRRTTFSESADPNDYELATFCDASQCSYGCVTYLISKVGKSWSSRLIFAKSRVAPVKWDATNKPLSIARLELLAAYIGARMGQYVKKALNLGDVRTHFFTDSLITLFRLRKGSGTFKMWVANRLKDILTRTKIEMWRHVCGSLNPSDFCSRPTRVKTLLNSDLWFKGPTFLRLSVDTWPSMKALSKEEAKEIERINKLELEKEDKPAAPKLLMTQIQRSIFDRFERWNEVIRLTCWIHRWRNKVQSRKLNKYEPIFNAKSQPLKGARAVNTARSTRNSQKAGLLVDTKSTKQVEKRKVGRPRKVEVLLPGKKPEKSNQEIRKKSKGDKVSPGKIKVLKQKIDKVKIPPESKKIRASPLKSNPKSGSRIPVELKPDIKSGRVNKIRTVVNIHKPKNPVGRPRKKVSKINPSQKYNLSNALDKKATKILATGKELSDHASIPAKDVQLKSLEGAAQKNAELAPKLISKNENQFSTNYISLQEFRLAELYWLKVAQLESFSKELNSLKAEKDLPSNCQLRKYLPYIDKQSQLLKARTRYTGSDLLPDQTRFPVILPRGNQIVEKFILFVHEQNMHSGPETTLYNIRKRYVLVGQRREVKRILRTCPNTKCGKPQKLSQQFSPLPSLRMDSITPWISISLDYFGPIICRHRCNIKHCVHPKEEKYYGLLLVDNISRAVSLENVASQSTDDFLMAFTRHVSRCGIPKICNSDRSKTYIKADQELQRWLKKLDWEQITNFAANKGFEWRFTCEKASWTNGVVERLIGSVKVGLKSALKCQKVEPVRFQTVLTEIQALLNNRPLCPQNLDLESQLPVTPALLCAGRNLGSLPDTEEGEEILRFGEPFSKQYALRKKVLNVFWSMWQKDYLFRMQASSKWLSKNKLALEVGQIVQLIEKNLSKNTYRMARIIELQRDSQNLVRRVRVKMPNGSELLRSIHHIALLEGCISKTQQTALHPDKNIEKTQ